MESQVAHPQGHGYGQDPNAVGLHSAVEGGDNEHHHEKKSVLKKVKAKAKKLKDTITKHGHGRGHDHPEGHVPDDHDLDEEDDEDEEVVEDPEIHEAPIVYESVAIVSSVDTGRSLGMGEDRRTPSDAGQEEKFGKPGVDLGRTGAMEEVLLRSPANTPQLTAPTRDPGTTQFSDPIKTFVHGMREAERGRPTVNLARPGGLEKDPHSPGSGREPSNYQTKVTDPTASGGEEADVSPVIRSLEKMAVQYETGPKSGTDQSLPAETRASYISNIPTGTGSYGQFPAEPTSMETDAASLGVDVTKREAHPRDQTEHKPSSPGSYTEKLSSATSVIAERAVSAKNLVALKLGYGERESPESCDAPGSETHSQGEKPSDQSSYTGKVSSATSAIADKAMLAKNIVAAKLGYGEKGDTTTSHNTGGTKSEPQGHETTAASGEPPEQSSYTGAILAIADKAISAKDTVASKLGYPKKEGEADTLSPGGNSAAKEQGKGIAATVTEKLSPVISKVTGSMTGQRAEAPGEVAGASQEKGVSVRDYLAEKLKPGEEDKALSEVISSALHKKKTAVEAEAATVVKVTESEEVKKRLGEEGEGQLNSPGKAMVDKLRGTVGSWFSKTNDSKAPQQPTRHDDSEAVSSAADEHEQYGGKRGLHESSN